MIYSTRVAHIQIMKFWVWLQTEKIYAPKNQHMIDIGGNHVKYDYEIHYTCSQIGNDKDYMRKILFKLR